MKLLLAILLGATFTSSTTAAITWDQPPGVAHTCLHRYYGAEYPAAICWRDLPAGPMTVTLPGDLPHPAYKPSFGDVYVLSFNGIEAGRATLGEAEVHTLYLGLIRKDAPEQVRRVYVPLVVGR